MAKIKRSEITEEIHWVFECPGCGQMTDVYEDPDCEEDVECEHCKVVFEIDEGE